MMRPDSDNARSETRPKKVRGTRYGEIGVGIPKDRKGTFEAQTVRNRRKDISSIEDISISIIRPAKPPRVRSLI